MPCSALRTSCTFARPGVIERMLLFKSGEPVSVRLIEETERLLRSNGYLYDVSIRPRLITTASWTSKS